MAQKRPSYVSIRARQRNIIEGMGSGQLTVKQAAKKLGVTPSELRAFTQERKPKEIRAAFNHSPAYRKLYEAGQRKNVKATLGVTRVYRYEFREEVLRNKVVMNAGQRRPNPKQVGRMVQRLYYLNNIGPQHWSAWTYEHGLPNSIDDIKLLWKNKRISDNQYRTALKVWRDDYPGMSDAYYAAYADLLSEVEEEE